jgi:hypothetical protein
MNNRGYLLLWAVVILMVVSMIVLSYANTVNTNFKIVQSIYRGESSVQKALGGLELAISHYKQNPSELYNLHNELSDLATREIYPIAGEDLSEYTFLQNYNIESIEVGKISEGLLSLTVTAFSEEAKRTIYSELTVNETSFEVIMTKVN